jgi:hypothetical protein
VTHQEAVDTLATERYLLDDMAGADRRAFEEHFFLCEECADDLRTASAMLQGAQEGFAGQTTSNVVAMPVKRAVVSSPAWYRSGAPAWAAAAVLAIVAGYQSFVVVPSLRRDTAPRAIVPVTLRPESRGGETIVPPVSPTEAVSLALDVNEAPQGGELTFDLSSADGRHIVSGRAPAPAPGTPLLLLMPAWTLRTPMHYILSVHDAAPSGRLLGEYRFAVASPSTLHP